MEPISAGFLGAFEVRWSACWLLYKKQCGAYLPRPWKTVYRAELIIIFTFIYLFLFYLPLFMIDALGVPKRYYYYRHHADGPSLFLCIGTLWQDAYSEIKSYVGTQCNHFRIVRSNCKFAIEFESMYPTVLQGFIMCSAGWIRLSRKYIACIIVIVNDTKIICFLALRFKLLFTRKGIGLTPSVVQIQIY